MIKMGQKEMKRMPSLPLYLTARCPTPALCVTLLRVLVLKVVIVWSRPTLSAGPCNEQPEDGDKKKTLNVDRLPTSILVSLLTTFSCFARDVQARPHPLFLS
jgi:hypothetical protein